MTGRPDYARELLSGLIDHPVADAYHTRTGVLLGGLELEAGNLESSEAYLRAAIEG